MAQRDLLRHEFADHDREIGDRANHQRIGGGLGQARRKAPALENLLKAGAEARAGENAGQDADERDADLDSRQKPARVLG